MVEWSERLMWLLVISCKGLIVVESTLWGIRSSSVVDTPKYLCILERVSAIWLSFPAVHSMVQSKVMRKSCYLLSFWLSGVRCMKVNRGLWSVCITNWCPLNWVPTKYWLSIIANNYFWKVGYVSCTGLNFRLRKQDGLGASKLPCHIHDPSSISLLSYIRYFGSLD